MSSHVLPPPVSPSKEDCFGLSVADLFGGVERVPKRLDPKEEIRFEFEGYRSLLTRAMREHGRQRLVKAVIKKRRSEVVPKAGEGGKRRNV